MIEADERIAKAYSAYPRQLEFHTNPAKYRLFGGQAGPGKSTALLWEAVGQAETPGADCLLLRRTYPELETSLILPFRRDVPWREVGAIFNESKHTVYWPNGSTLRFGYCESERDVYQYQGGEFKFIGIDELTMFTLSQWQFLTSRNRCRVRGARPCMAGATNPGNIGHAWVKALWVDKHPPAGMQGADQYDPSDYAFIRARLEDNPVYANDREYIAVLDALPTHLRQMFREGSWEVFAGQYFDVWAEARHTVSRREVQLESWSPRWVSGDWGFQHPACFHFHAKVGRKTVTYAELWGRGMNERNLAEMLTAIAGEDHITAFYLSPDAWAKRSDAFSVAQQLGEELGRMNSRVPYPIQASTDRVGGARMLYKMLLQDEWVVSDVCENLIECMPQLIHDEPPRAEDVLKVDNGPGQLGDDAYDSARYGLYSHFRPGQKTKEQEVRDQAEKYSDPLEKWSYLRLNLPKEEENEPFRLYYQPWWIREQ